MGYVFGFNDALNYERWFSDEKNRLTVASQTGLMQAMLRPVCGEKLLDIGCGTGLSLRPFLGKGIELTGIDPSPYMLDIAQVNLGHRVDLYRGYSENLPFGDNEFNHAVLFLTLEFTDDPVKAVAEACRVAKDCVFIGILNKYSMLSLQRKIGGWFRNSIFNHARFFSIGDVHRMLVSQIGQTPFFWRTVLQLPFSPRGFLSGIESNRFVQKSPFGGFAGMVSIPVPRFTTIPMALKARMNHAAAPGERVVSCAENYKNEKPDK